MRNRYFLLFSTFLLVFLFCQLPQNPDSPQNADASITMFSLYYGTNDTLIIDSTGGVVNLTLSYKFPTYIDSVKISLYSKINGTIATDTSILISFSATPVQNTQFNLKLKTEGQKSLVAYCYINNGTVKTDSAQIIVYPRSSSTNTHTPVFAANSPSPFYELKNGQKLDFPVTAHDSDNNALIYTFKSGMPQLPRFSTASLQSGRFTWLSDATDKGAFPVIFEVTDGKYTVEKTVLVIVNDSTINIAPEIISTPARTVAAGQKWTYKPSVIDFKDTAFTWKLQGKNAVSMEFDSLTGEINWTPSLQILSSDTLTLIVIDKKMPPLSDSQVFVITVTSEGNTPPVVTPLALTLTEDDSLEITLTGSDVQTPLSALVFSLHTGVSNGKLGELRGNKIVYSPKENFFGKDSFYYRASDGTFFSDSAKVSLTIMAANDTPTVSRQALATGLNTQLTITLKGSDIEDSVLTFQVTRGPVSGIVDTSALPVIKYTPSNNFKGKDSLFFRATDKGGLKSKDGIVTIAVASDNLKPTVSNLSVTIKEDTDSIITLKGNDLETPAAQLVYKIYKNPSHGKLGTITGNKVLYQPQANYSGVDTFYYNVNDGILDSDSGMVLMQIVPVNDTPAVSNQALATGLNTQLSITLKGSDIEDSVLIFHVTRGPVSGTLDTSALPVIKYTPSNNFKGNDTLFFRATDKGGVQSNGGVITIAVASGNQKPTVSSLSINIDEDKDTTITLKGADIETPAALLVYSIYKEPLHGILNSVIGDHVNYKPDLNYSGVDTFYYIVNDGTLDSDSGRVIIRIAAGNDKSVAVEDQYVTIEDQVLTISATEGVLKNDTDPEGDSFTAEVVDSIAAGKGSLIFNTNGSFIYTPAANLNGTVTFTYRLKDVNGAYSDKVSVTIAISPVNDIPVISGLTAITVNEGDSVIREIVASDVDQTTPIITITSGQKSWITATTPADNRIRLVVKPGYDVVTSGTSTVTKLFFTASDGTASKMDSLQVTVSNVNQKPVVSLNLTKTTDTVQAGESKSITASATDPDGTISKVVLYFDNTPSTDNTSPYQFPLTNIAYGKHTIYAIAIDNNNDTSRTNVYTVKAGRWNRIDSISNFYQYTNDFDNDGVPVHYSMYNLTNHLRVEISRFNLISGLWDNFNSMQVSPEDTVVYGQPKYFSLAFAPDNRPVVALEFKNQTNESATLMIFKLLADGAWSRIGEVVNFTGITPIMGITHNVSVSSTGNIAFCVNHSNMFGPESSFTYVQNGNSWNRVKNPIYYTIITYLGTTLYSHCGSYYGLGATQVHSLSGTTWSPVGSADGTVTPTSQSRSILKKSSNGTIYISVPDKGVFSYQGSTWQKIGPSTTDPTLNGISANLVNNTPWFTYTVEGTNSTINLYLKQIQNGTETGVLGQSGLVFNLPIGYQGFSSPSQQGIISCYFHNGVGDGSCLLFKMDIPN